MDQSDIGFLLLFPTNAKGLFIIIIKREALFLDHVKNHAET